MCVEGVCGGCGVCVEGVCVEGVWKVCVDSVVFVWRVCGGYGGQQLTGWEG